MSATTLSPPNPNPNPNPDGILTLALPAPIASTPTVVPTQTATPTPPSAAARKRSFPAPCWTHEENLALIDSYREKWFANHFMNLRAPHWQEVADDLARRCQHMLNSDPPTTTPKTAIQCRHKMEKVRKRYRLDWERSLRLHPNSPPHSTWVYFRKMDDMNIAARSSSSMVNQRSTKKAPLPVAAKSPSSSSKDESETSSEEEEESDGGENNRMGNGISGRRGWAPQPTVGYRFKIPKMDREKVGIPLNSVSGGRLFGYGNSDFKETKRKRDEYEDEKDDLRGGNCSSVMGEIASAVRMLGEGFMKMEKLKMDMTREFEKVKMEMELKRTQMILESHRQIVDAFVTGLVGRKKKNKRAKISPDSSS